MWDDFELGELFYKNRHLKDDIIFLQYTGLKDKNEREKYKGDILEWQGKGKNKGERCAIEWHKNGKWSSSIDDEHAIQLVDWVVIGNIYENPELLK